MDLDFIENDLRSLSLPRATSITVPDGAIDLFPNNIGPKIFLLPEEDWILKVGSSVKLSEADAMQFVARNTSVPVPIIHDVYEKEGNGYIFMSRVHGEPLGQMWNNLCTEQKVSVIRQLNHYITELEALSADFYGALWNLASEDIFFKHFPFTNEEIRYGPYSSRREYNAGLIAALANSRPDHSLSASDQALAERLLRIDDERKVFSHGDIHLFNILIDDTCRITGIIDWEGAGFSIRGRDYYEARARSRNGEWADALLRIFPEDAQVHYELLKELDEALKCYTGI